MSAGLRTRVEYSVALLVQVVSQPRRGGTCAGAQKTASAPRYTSHLSNTPRHLYVCVFFTQREAGWRSQ